MEEHRAIHQSIKRVISGLTVAAVAATGLLVNAGPAAAAVTVTLSAANGRVGVAQTLSATVASSAVGSPTGTVTFSANGQQVGSPQQVGGSSGSKTQVSWTPTTAASTIIEARFITTGTPAETASDSETVSIAKVDTASTITTPGTAAAQSKVPLIATVTSKQGTYVPTGQVSFELNNGTVIGTAQLDGSGRASINYTTPATAGTVYVLASYPGDGNANASKTAVSALKVTTNASGVAVTVGSPAYANTAVKLTAKLTPSSAQGTVEFAVNDKAIGTSKVSSGSATLNWTPTAAGNYTVTAKYSGGGGLAASTGTAKATVTQPLKTDQITVDPEGSAPPLVVGRPTTMANGTSANLVATATSGLAVKLTATGPCAFSGTVLHIKGNGGPCTLTASTSGGGGWAPATAKYTITTTAGRQAARVAAPQSGRYAKGRKLFLSRVAATTNVGQPIRWRVTTGRSHCRVVQGSVWFRLKLTARGRCTVRASAPPVSDQWLAWSTGRTYIVR